MHEVAAGVDHLPVAVDIDCEFRVVDVQPLEALAEQQVSDSVVGGAIFFDDGEALEVFTCEAVLRSQRTQIIETDLGGRQTAGLGQRRVAEEMARNVLILGSERQR